MGCDIHMVMEYRAVPGAEDRTPWWRAFGGVCNPGRDYVLFNRLAGVRGPEGGALIPARGLPDSFSPEVHGALLFSIWDTPLPTVLMSASTSRWRNWSAGKRQTFPRAMMS